jgi:DNA-binding CsgD family transcriptional regulator
MSHQSLSPREHEIVDRVAEGRSTKEIAAELSIAESTVNWHVGNVLTKLNASSRAEAVARVLRGGMNTTAPRTTDRPVRKRRLARLWQTVAALVATGPTRAG